MNFETYWKEIGRYLPEINYEDILHYKLCKKIWNDTEHLLELNTKEQFDRGYTQGYDEGYLNGKNN